MASSRVLLIVCVLLVSSFAPITVTAESNDSRNPSPTVKIGFLNEITGPLYDSHFGWTAAAEKAITDLNADGGNFELVMEDSACNADVAVGAAEALVEANVVGVAGPGCSGPTMAALPVLSTAGIPLVSWYGSSQQLGDESANPGLLFRIAQEEGQQGEALYHVFSQSNSTNPGIIRSVLGDPPTDANSFNLAYELDGGTTCAEYGVAQFDTDFGMVVQGIFDSGCDSVVLLPLNSEQALGIILELYLQGFEGEIFASDGILEDFDFINQSIEASGGLLDGIEITSRSAGNVSDTMNEFVTWCTNNTSCNTLIGTGYCFSYVGCADYVYDSVRLVGESYLLSVNNGYSVASSILIMGQMWEGATGTISLMDNGDSVGNGWDVCELSYSSNLTLYCNDTWYPINNFSYVDSDGDGYLDWVDDCPNDPDGWSDGDRDGACNNTDADDDGDGWSDEIELLCGGNPLMFSSIPEDFDIDGICDGVDDDDDNDGVLDWDDAFPFNSNEWEDTDGDGVGNNADLDDDDDGRTDVEEQYCGSDELDADSVPEDYDHDGLCNGADYDDDDDGWSDVDEYQCYTEILDNNSVPTDTDGDSICDAVDDDDDGDGYLDGDDAFPLDRFEWLDTDSDGTGNNADLDDDGDLWRDSQEIECGYDPLDLDSIPLDTDLDNWCNELDHDDDGDSIIDEDDPFPLNSAEWSDIDADGIGDNTDTDDDDDGWTDSSEVICGSDPLDKTSSPHDFDGDEVCDAVDMDDDDDGHPDASDIFPFNQDEWLDTDQDGVGNNEDDDDDGDTLSDGLELQLGTNPLASDTDDDGFDDAIDALPLDPSEWSDLDEDGAGDNSDAFPTVSRYQTYGGLLLDVAVVSILVGLVAFMVKRFTHNKSSSDEEE